MILHQLEADGLLAIIRGLKKETLMPVVEALQAGGVKSVEVTCNTPGALEMIAQLSRQYRQELLIGAGTVLDAITARQAIDAGAQFILAPNLSQEVIEVGNLYGKPVIPGVMSPSEITEAMRWGAKMVKIFPAGTLGHRYVADVLGPLSQAKIMAVGGVSLANAAQFLQAGVAVLGIGSELVDKELIRQKDFAGLTKKAKLFFQVIAEAKLGEDR